MNKKRLSVVMAGAMLATSVAPVLAAEEAKSLSESQLTIYANNIKKLMEENKIDTTNHQLIYGANKATKFVSVDVSKEANRLNGKSVYGVSKDGGKTVEYGITDAINLIKGAKAGEKIEIIKYATTNFHGLLIPGSEITTLGTDKADKYTEDDFDANFNTLKTTLEKSVYIKSVEAASDKKSATVTLEALDENDKNKTLTLSVGDAKINEKLPMSGDNLLKETTKDTDDIQKCDGFMRLQKWNLSDKSADPESVYETINIVADEDPTVEKLAVKDLYDGTILTSKGTEILNDLKNDKVANAGTNKYVELGVAPTANGAGINTFEVKYYVKNDNDAAQNKELVKTLVISSTNKSETKALHNILTNGYSVGIVGGSNRYATAVNVAKQQGVVVDKTNNKNIVLVNGDALVDGLSAAPLAASLNASGNAAPILLSKSDSLPKETKDYLNTLTKDLSTKDRKDVVVTLVGGEAVLTSNLEDELTGMGFKVERLGGDNREETSLEVAEVVNKGAANGKEVFVVGAEGEADAMSISAVAARDKKAIIVAKAGGISKDALKYIEKQGDNDAIIIGGTSVFSKEDEDKINEIKSDDATTEAVRIAGANRTETNAKILEKYYAKGVGTGTVKPVILAKNGMTNGKYELVDALTAANLGGPIVLANDKLSAEQENAILNANKTVNATHIIQVGEGLNPDVIKSVSKLLGLKNNDK